jgi:hypothetical protein
MKLTVIPSDRLIQRDGVAHVLPTWSLNDAHIHAIQWDGKAGETEYTGNPKPPNSFFSDKNLIAPYLTALEKYLASVPTPVPAAPRPDYVLFWDALLASTVYGSIRTQSMASLPMNTLATEFIALLGDAKAGRPSEPAIQASMDAILSTGTFTAAQATELSQALKAGRLGDIYTVG